MRQGWDFTADLFKLYSDVILSELETLSGFIITGCNFNNIRYADETVLMADLKRKIHDLHDSLVEGSKIKELTINWKKTEVLSSARENVQYMCYELNI